jgi:phage/plasmid-associated DNA primase
VITHGQEALIEVLTTDSVQLKQSYSHIAAAMVLPHLEFLVMMGAGGNGKNVIVQKITPVCGTTIIV